MTLSSFVRVLPAYTKVHVHDNGSEFACQGNPHNFTMAPYRQYGDYNVTVAIPIAPYEIEVTVSKEVPT